MKHGGDRKSDQGTNSAFDKSNKPSVRQNKKKYPMGSKSTVQGTKLKSQRPNSSDAKSNKGAADFKVWLAS